MPPPLEAFAADLLALLEAPAPCAARDREPGTAGPRAVPAAVPAGPAISSKENNDLQKPGPLGPPGPRKTDVSGLAPIAERATPPATPAPEPVTVDDLLDRFGPLLVAGTVRTLDVLAEADDGDLPDFLDNRPALEAFAVALVADHQVRPLPAASLPPLERLALEIVDDLAELRRWLDLSAQGRRIRARIEREAGACDRVLLGLRADPDAGLHGLLVRALEGHQDDDRTRKPQDDERAQDRFGAWRTPAEHERIEAYDRHHWTCDRCIRAGRGYGARCEAGARLHAATRASR